VAYLHDPRLGQACALYERFTGRAPQRLSLERMPRPQPGVLVDLGELTALVYRAARRADAPRQAESYVHRFDVPPRLLADAAGRRLFIAGGRFRVTRRGIEG
jgi:hypothetical protein